MQNIYAKIGESCTDKGEDIQNGGKVCFYNAYCNPVDKKCYETCLPNGTCELNKAPRKNTFFCDYTLCDPKLQQPPKPDSNTSNTNTSGTGTGTGTGSEGSAVTPPPIIHPFRPNDVRPIIQNVPNTTNWYDANKICSDQGKKLCSRKAICPANNVWGGTVDVDEWTPTSDLENNWVHVGRVPERLCKTHQEITGGRPAWGESSEPFAYRKRVFCCDVKEDVEPQKSEAEPSVPAGAKGGGPQNRFQCEDGELLVGMKTQSGNWIDGIGSLYCNTTENIQMGKVPREVKVGWGGGGGGATIFQCPKGFALKGYEVHSGNWIDGMQLSCKNVVQDSQVSVPYKSPWIAQRGTSIQDIRACPTNSFLSGLTVRSGNALDQIIGECTDISAYVKTFNDPKEQLKCCAGINTDTLTCGPWDPQSLGGSRCLATKQALCSQREYFFTEGCKQLLAPTERQVQNQSDNIMAQTVCTQVKNDPASTEAEKDWCGCFNAEVDVETPMAARGLFQCINPICSAKGLKPFGLKCPDTVAICTQKDFTTELSKSNIGRQYIANECGNIEIKPDGGPSAPSGPSGSGGSGGSGGGSGVGSGGGSGVGSGPSGSEVKGLFKNPYLVGGLAIGAIILLAVLFLLYKIMSRLGQIPSGPATTTTVTANKP